MTLEEFEELICDLAERSPICDTVAIVGVAEESIKIRVGLYVGGFIETYYNERNGTISYAWIRDGRRVFGADNANRWHYHPFEDPARHEWLDHEMSFAEFLAAIENNID